MCSARYFVPVDLPSEGTIIVRARNAEQAQLWIREQPALLPGQRRFAPALDSRTIEGVRPAAIVLLPGWHDHPRHAEITGAVDRACWRVPGDVLRIPVREAR